VNSRPRRSSCPRRDHRPSGAALGADPAAVAGRLVHDLCDGRWCRAGRFPGC
jgi:hypothetical protein